MNHNLIGTMGYILKEDGIEETSTPIDWAYSGWWHSLMECVSQNDASLRLRASTGDYAVVTSEDYRLIGTPKYHAGDSVRATTRNRTGVIRSIFWHHKNREFIYMLDYGDRKSTRWYHEDELEPMDPDAAGKDTRQP